ncbi:unnamed protein product [Adineta ricciae]|uniref:Uncharacterized protein n=1 Tax=Adineta ricciae TaxID=249248 RepID=A0A813XVA8_ADIRI|nr:unnamed protein product [Adineta ricciae]CAF1264126.1 unnamed protein product [Adineta ricciae]
MRFSVLFTIITLTICLCLWLMPSSTEAYIIPRQGFGRCPPCHNYCPCGYIFEDRPCPSCHCRPSNLCTGRNKNGIARWPFIKSHIVY